MTGNQIPLTVAFEKMRQDTPWKFNKSLHEATLQIPCWFLSAGFFWFVSAKAAKIRRLTDASWRENVISICFRFMISEVLTILVYHTEGSSPSGAVLRQGPGPEVCGRVRILSGQNFNQQLQVDCWIHGKGTFTRIVQGYSLFGPGLLGVKNEPSRQGLELRFGMAS